jgi:hypothetical protein
MRLDTEVLNRTSATHGYTSSSGEYLECLQNAICQDETSLIRAGGFSLMQRGVLDRASPLSGLAGDISESMFCSCVKG